MAVAEVSSTPVEAGAVHDEGRRDVIFSFAYASWGTAVSRGMCFSEDRLAQTLLAHPGWAG